MVTVGAVNINKVSDQLPPMPEHTLILPTRNLVLFPGVTLPIQLGREQSVSVARMSEKTGVPLGVVCQLDPDTENPTVKDLYHYGVFAHVHQVVELPDGHHTAIVSAGTVFRVLEQNDMPDALAARVKPIRDVMPRSNREEFDNVVEQIRTMARDIVKETFDGPREMALPIDKITDPVELINMTATHLPLDVPVKEGLLAKSKLMDRAIDLLGALINAQEKIGIAREVMEKARSRVETNQRNMFLQQQIEVMRDELGDNDDSDLAELEERARKTKFPEAIRKQFDKELAKLGRYNPSSPDYSVQYSYLDTLLNLPWGKVTKPNTDFAKAEQILEDDHYGLRKVKDRVLEQLALLMHNPKGHAPIICLVGPPGVGKTSLGQSIAAALGRKYQRVSLGGLHDEAEIRGHRRTYIGAMPGRIIDAVKRSGTSNPVLLLDELDKIGADYKGDPAAALLEALDPEQNCRFHDNYVDVDFDLSGVLFLATANTLSTISRPLLDRIEVIELSGYVNEEKIEIAKRHLLPRLLKDNNAGDMGLDIPDQTLDAIIDNYTSESGVRQLEKRLAAIVRKRVLAKMRNTAFPSPVTPGDLHELLGVLPHNREKYEGNDFAGVVTGLAWTEVGGEILLTEVSLSPGKGDKVTVTGNLGKVMTESATLAMQWVKSNAAVLGIDNDMFDKNNVHIHFPEGAVPKDGPSAGITIVTAIVSAFTRRRVRGCIAMTGEITLRGKVLPVGGIREKILAAKRAGIDTVILSSENRKDIGDIEPQFVSGMNFEYVDTIAQVIDHALLKETV